MTQTSQQLRETQGNCTFQSESLKEADNNRDTKQIKKYKPPAYLNQMNEIEKEMNLKIIQNMNKRVNFLKNPRFVVKNPLLTYKHLMENSEFITEQVNAKSPFRSSPAEIAFEDYKVQQIYQQKLTITNVGKISRRLKYMPPSTEQFSISNIVYPNDNTLIAPGMSVIFTINFKATSLANFDDELGIITDTNIFRIPFKAEKEKPRINLLSQIIAQSCWVGDRTDILYKITNKGGPGGFKFFGTTEFAEKRSNKDFLITENFMLQPRQFHLKKDESLELEVTFLPSKEGKIVDEIILACDNQTSSKHTLEGQANIADLNLISLNKNEFNSKGEIKVAIDKLYFMHSILNQKKKNKLVIANATNVNVNFHWGIFQSSSIKNHDIQVLEEEDHDFEVTPKKGIFGPEQKIKFKFTFIGTKPLPYLEYACLILDDLPVAAIKDLPPLLDANLKESLAMKGNQKYEGPAYLMNNSAKQSIVIYEFQLVGQVDPCKASIDRPYQELEGPLFLNESYSTVFKIKNKSLCPLYYDIEEIGINQNNVLEYHISNNEGEIEKLKEIEVTVTVQCQKICENQKLEFQLNVKDGDPVYFELFCKEFIGPQIRINQSLLNFGLIQSFSKSTIQIEIENLTKIPASIIFRDPEKENINFESSMFFQYNYYCLDEKLIKNEIMIGNNKLIFNPYWLQLESEQKQTVEITLESLGPETIEEAYIQVLVKDSNEQYILEVFGEIQNIFVKLSPPLMNLGTIYAGKQLVFPQALTITNIGNIKTFFNWEDGNSSSFKISFKPKCKEILPKQSIPIEVELTPQRGDDFSELFLCNVEGLKFPLGFELNCLVEGLNVIYELLDVDDPSQILAPTKTQKPENKSQVRTSQPKLTKKTEIAETIKGSTKTRVRGQKKKTLAQLTMEQSGSFKRGTNMLSSVQMNSVTLEILEFLTCKINEPKQMRFSMRNTSGLTTTFLFDVLKFAPLYYKDNIELQSRTKTKAKSKLQVTTNSSKKLNLKEDKDQDHQQLLTADIEDTQNFSSVSGQALNVQRKLEKEQKFYLLNNKGIAIVCEPHEGILEAYQEKIIKVTIFNDICGHFEDYIKAKIEGLDDWKIPVIINVTGSPLIVQPNQVGVRYIGDHPSLNVGTVMRKHQPITRQFKLENTGPKDLEFQWKLYDLGSVAKANKFFDLQIGNPEIGTKDVAKLYWKPVKPKEADNDIFSIRAKNADEDQQQNQPCIIKARKKATYVVTFKSEDVGLYKYVLIAKPSLANQLEGSQQIKPKKENVITGQSQEAEEQKNKSFVEEDDDQNNIGTLALNLYGETIQPKLTFEKISRENDEQIIKFQKWSIGNSGKESKHICLINHKKTNIIFMIELEGPFKLLESKTNSPVDYALLSSTISTQKCQTNFNLVQNSNMELSIQFQGPKINDYKEWPLTFKVFKHGKLTINYSNGDTQVITLSGVLMRPLIQLNTTGYQSTLGPSVLDFGIIHINNKGFLAIYLQNLTKIPAKWQLKYVSYPVKKLKAPLTKTELEEEDEVKTDDKEVFNFDITAGVIYGPSIPLSQVPIGPSLPTRLTNEDNFATRKLPQKIMISFHPKKNILYKSKYTITVEEGPSVSFILKGQGTYDEFMEK